MWLRAEVHRGFWWRNVTERHRLEDPGVDERIILKLIFDKWVGDMGWIDLAQDKNWWWVLVNAALNVRVP
jgi:hypothetical protein